MAKKSDIHQMAREMAEQMVDNIEKRKRQKAIEKKQEDALRMRVGKSCLCLIRKFGLDGDPVEIAAACIKEKYGERENG